MLPTLEMIDICVEKNNRLHILKWFIEIIMNYHLDTLIQLMDNKCTEFSK